MSDALSDWAKEWFRNNGLMPVGAEPLAAKPVSHARLGFSGADRWMACGASVRASEGLPDMVTPYAREGSVAHEVAAHCLIDEADAIDWLDKKIDLGDNGPLIAVDEMMVEGVQSYLDLVSKESEYGFNPDIVKVVEHQGSLERLDPAFFQLEPIFGTCDCRLYNRRTRRLTIIDFKYGYRFVAVEGKPQTRGYALMEMLSDELINEKIVDIELIICQPRSPRCEGEPVRRQVITVEELLRWATEEMLPAAKRTLDPDAPFVAGDHCVFCRYAPQCAELRRQNFETAALKFSEPDIIPDPATSQPLEPTRLSADQLARVLSLLPRMETWAKNVRLYAFGLANAGIAIRSDDGLYEWKLVARRGRRKWVKDEADIRAAMQIDWGIPEELLDTKKLRSPAQMEAAFKEVYGKEWRKKATQLSKRGLYDIGTSSVALVPATDTREAITGVEIGMFEPLE